MVAVATVVACAPPLDERQPEAHGSFGEVVATLLCKRIAYQESLRGAAEPGATVDVAGELYDAECRLGLAAPPGAPAAVAAFLAVRPRLIGAIDTLAPDDQLPLVQELVTSDGFLATYDDGTTDAAIESLADAMTALADDAEFSPALSRLRRRLGYLPLASSQGLLHRMSRYPALASLLRETATALAGGGSLVAERRALEAALAAELATARAVTDPSDPERTLAIALDLLLDERPELSTGTPIVLVRRDARGLARVAVGADDPIGFVDDDGDGLADVDANGRFVGADGEVLDAPTPFELAPDVAQAWPYRDAQGRALAADAGAPIYEYLDVDRTVLAALARDGLELVHPDRGVAMELAAGAALLGGERRETSREYSDGTALTYTAYDGPSSVLLDLAHAYLSVLADPRVDDALSLAATLLTEHEPTAARLTGAVIGAARKADQFPNAALEPDSALYDDLMPVVVSILETPGLAEDLLRAMESPEVAELGIRFADQMSYRDAIDLDPDTQQLTVASLSRPVDRSAADSGENRSLLQRLLHLISDSNGTVLCNKEGAVVRDPQLGVPLQSYSECELLRIPNLAVFYLQSIAYAKDADGDVIYDDVDGQPTPRPKALFPFEFNNPVIEALATDETLEEESTIEGFRHHPTPQALNRAMFLDPLPPFLADTMDPARCNQGDRYIDAHAATLMAWELDGFYDQIRPIAQAFADHDAEQLLVDIMVVLHRHWASPDSADHQSDDPEGAEYVAASAAVRYEPLLIELLRDRGLLDAAVAAAPVLASIEVGGAPAVDALAGAARALFVPRPGLAARDGSTTTTGADGRAIDTLSSWYLLADAYAAKNAALAADPVVAEGWNTAVARVIDVLLTTEEVDGAWRFANPRVRGVTSALIDFVRRRTSVHDEAGDRAAWLATDLPGRLHSVTSGPLFAAVLDFMVGAARQPAVRAELDGLLAFLLDEAADPAGFATVVTSAADLLQLALDDGELVPLVRGIGRVLAPERGLLDAQLELAGAIAGVDFDGVFATLVRHGMAESGPGHLALGDVADAVLEVNRAHPYEELGEPYDADDYRSAFRAVAGFLTDEKRGLAKLVAIIRSRSL